MPDEARIRVDSELGVVAARQAGRQMAGELGFSTTDQALIATAISEMARNIIQYARSGDISIELISREFQRGIQVTAKDEGPGIPNVEMALRDGYTSGKGMGMGIPGARRLMDEFAITSEVDRGTTVVMKKWLTMR